jgi:hypothetical protein
MGEPSLFKVPDPNLIWVGTLRNDLAYAIWNTATWNGSKYVRQVPDGKYDLKLEVFDATGKKLNPATSGFKFLLPTNVVGVTDDALYIEAGGELIMHLHVDNNDTVAEIQNVYLNGVKAGDCQFLEYEKLSDKVEVEYVAYHPTSPWNFLDYYVLSVTRGISGTYVAGVNSGVPVKTPTKVGYSVGDLLKYMSAGVLKHHERCAFSIWLHTYPRTRDGNSRIRAYEDSDRSSFALTK